MQYPFDELIVHTLYGTNSKEIIAVLMNWFWFGSEILPDEDHLIFLCKKTCASANMWVFKLLKCCNTEEITIMWEMEMNVNVNM